MLLGLKKKRWNDNKNKFDDLSLSNKKENMVRIELNWSMEKLKKNP